MACTLLLRSLSGLSCVIVKDKITVNNLHRINQFVSYVRQKSIYVPRCISSSSFSTVGKNTDLEGKPKKRKGPKITLLGIDESMSVISLEEAQKLAKRRDLKLVRITDLDTNLERPTYRLMTGAQYFEEDLQQRKLKAEKRKTEIKRQKLLTISAKISEHDLQSRVKNVQKWLDKNCEAQIVITEDGTGSEAVDNIFQTFQSQVKDHGNLSHKQQKGNTLKFKIQPLRKKVEPPATAPET